MGLLSYFNRFRLKLTDTDRETIWRVFGSFNANKFGMNGNQLIENSYEKNLDVFAVIKKIVDVSKSVPWVVEQYTGGRWKELKDTPFHELMERPNVSKNYSWDDVEEQILVYLLCTGNAYLLKNREILKNSVAEVDVLPSPFVTIESNNDFFLPEVKYRFQFGKHNRIFEAGSDIAHIRFFNPGYSSVNDSFYGLSIIQVAAAAIQVGNDKWDAHAALLQNRGAMGFVTDRSNRPMTPDEAKEVQSAWERRTAGVEKYGKVTVTNKDLNYIQLAMSSADLELIKTGVVNLRAICNVFGIDSSMFNDPENKTYANRAEAEKAFYTNCIMPLSNKIAEFYTNNFAKELFPGKTVRIKQDFSDVECLQEAFHVKARTYISLVQAGIMSADTAAEYLELPKIEQVSEGGGVNDAIGKTPLALQQLALAAERAQEAGDVELAERIRQTMDALVSRIVNGVLKE